jgi:hypothetical protein
MTAEDSSGGGVAPRPGTACAASRKEDDAVAVRVAVHIRPLVEQELAKGCQEILDVSPGQPQVGNTTPSNEWFRPMTYACEPVSAFH